MYSAPSDIIRAIASYADTCTLIMFGSTCTRIYSLISHPRYPIISMEYLSNPRGIEYFVDIYPVYHHPIVTITLLQTGSYGILRRMLGYGTAWPGTTYWLSISPNIHPESVVRSIFATIQQSPYEIRQYTIAALNNGRSDLLAIGVQTWGDSALTPEVISTIMSCPQYYEVVAREVPAMLTLQPAIWACNIGPTFPRWWIRAFYRYGVLPAPLPYETTSGYLIHLYCRAGILTQMKAAQMLLDIGSDIVLYYIRRVPVDTRITSWMARAHHIHQCIVYRIAHGEQVNLGEMLVAAGIAGNSEIVEYILRLPYSDESLTLLHYRTTAVWDHHIYERIQYVRPTYYDAHMSRILRTYSTQPPRYIQSLCIHYGSSLTAHERFTLAYSILTRYGGIRQYLAVYDILRHDTRSTNFMSQIYQQLIRDGDVSNIRALNIYHKMPRALLQQYRNMLRD